MSIPMNRHGVFMIRRIFVFNGLPSDLVVYVPAGTLAAYQAASNYSSIKNKMVEMSA